MGYLIRQNRETRDIRKVTFDTEDRLNRYEKVMYKCYYFDKRRLFSSLVSDLGEHTKHKFNNLLQLDDALPPSLRNETMKRRSIVKSAETVSYRHEINTIYVQQLIEI